MLVWYSEQEILPDNVAKCSLKVRASRMAARAYLSSHFFLSERENKQIVEKASIFAIENFCRKAIFHRVGNMQQVLPIKQQWLVQIVKELKYLVLFV